MGPRDNAADDIAGLTRGRSVPMSTAAPDASIPAEPGLLGPDPGLPIRRWAAFLLRMGIGLGLFNTGLAGYMAVAVPRGMGPGMPTLGPGMPTFGGFLPIFGPMPYIEIALGMALILGFLTTASSIAAGLQLLLMPCMLTIQLATSGASSPGMMMPGRGWGIPNAGMLMMMEAGMLSLPGLLTHAALIWLSPLANHPYSIDALIFGRAAPEAFSMPDPGPSDGPASGKSPVGGPPAGSAEG